MLCAPLNTGLVQRNPATSQYLVNLWTLHTKFETAIDRYRADLDTDQELQRRFGAMFPKYGTIGVGFATLRTA